MLNKSKFRIPQFDPENLAVYWQKIGFCVMQIQTFELTLGYYLTQVHKIDLDMSVNKITNLYNKYGKFTIGQLFKEVKECEKLPDELEQRINNFIKERNWLVHNIRKENESDLFFESKFNLLLQRINILADEALFLAKLFQEKSEEYILRNKIMSEEQLDHYTQILLNYFGKA